MTRWLTVAAAVALLLAACSGGDDDDSPTPASDRSPEATETAEPPDDTPTPTEPEATETPESLPSGDEHDGDRAFEDIEVLAVEIGPRVAGSEDEAAAIDYIAAEFEEAGYEVEILPFTFTTDRIPTGTVTVGDETLDAVPLNGSREASAEGEAVYVGLATTEEVAGADLEGRIAVADRGITTFREKYDAVVEAGAIGLVIVNDEPGYFEGGVETIATIPVLAAPGEARDALLDAADEGATISLAVELGGEMTSHNVLARSGDTETCDILLGGHHDTVPLAPGAHDNASGVANVLELARAFAADGLDDGLCFATFGAEESGLFGSQALAAAMAEDGALPTFMLNFDVTGIGDTVELIGDTTLVDLAIELGDGLGIIARPGSIPAGASSDHASFADQGVPVLFFVGTEFDTIHTPGDVVEDIEVDELDRVGDLGYAVVAALLAER